MNERLQKLIAASGLASRRQAEELIRQGRVAVNGATATLGMSAGPDDRVTVNGKPLTRPKGITYLLNKPVGVVCSTKRQRGERIVTDLVPATPAVYPIGRLDKESGGLILLTNDGALAQRLAHPSYGHRKAYKVIAKWKPDAKSTDAERVRHLLLTGVKLGDGKAKADHLTVTVAKDKVILDIAVHEGRHHLVRRMCATAGLAVTSLVRVQLAGLNLEKVPVGGYRILTDREIKGLLTVHAPSPRP